MKYKTLEIWKNAPPGLQRPSHKDSLISWDSLSQGLSNPTPISHLRGPFLAPCPKTRLCCWERLYASLDLASRGHPIRTPSYHETWNISNKNLFVGNFILFTGPTSRAHEWTYVCVHITFYKRESTNLYEQGKKVCQTTAFWCYQCFS